MSNSNDNNGYVKWPGLWMVVSGILVGMMTLMGFIFKIHDAQPHPGAVNVEHLQAVVQPIKEDIAEIKMMIRNREGNPLCVRCSAPSLK